MSEQTEPTLPTAASITYLKNEAKALRAAFDDADAAARTRVGALVSPVPTTLAQAQALFVIAREYGFRSWPILKRHVQRQTRTVFSDAEGGAQVLSEILGDANVTIAESLAEALESTSEVVLLDLHVRRDKPFPESRRDEFRARKLIVTGPWADELCRELDLEIGGGNIIEARPLRILDSVLLGPTTLGEDNSFQPFAELEAPTALNGWPDQRLAFQYAPEELRASGDSGFVEILVAPADGGDEVAVVAREANCVFAGVTSHPRRWSDDYRFLFGRVVTALADRELDEYRPAIVPKPAHPPGRVRFDLGAATDSWPFNESSRDLYFQFERPMVFTASLKHRGSDEVALVFSGGRQKYHFTREDAGQGDTLTIALTIGQAAIDAMVGRYWWLGINNYDNEHAMSAELSVRYDALEGGAIRPLPSDASFEHAHWFAERLETGNAQERRQEAARSFGFDDWQTLVGHVAWSEAKPPKDGAPMCDAYFALAQAKHGESFGLAELTEFNAPLLEVQDDLHRAIEAAFAIAEAQGHASVGVEHLLIPLLDDPAAEDALSKCGADVAALRRDLLAALESVPAGDAPATSRELFGVLGRSDLSRALGREGANAATVLVGMFAESCQAKVLLEGQGLRRRDVILYLAHGIPKLPPTRAHTTGVLGPMVEGVLHAAYLRAQAEHHEAFGVEHVLRGVADLLTADQAGSGSEEPSAGEREGLAPRQNLRRMRAELDAFLATTPRGTGQPGPTRALNRVMQQAVVRARRTGDGLVDVETLRKAVATERNTFAVDVLRRYGLVAC